MRILTSSEMRVADTNTFTSIGVPSRAVMECAGRAVANLITEQFPDEILRGVVIIAGGGNNGGDGFVIARALNNFGVSTQVFHLKSQKELSGDAKGAAEAYANSGGEIIELSEKFEEESSLAVSLASCGVVVDAIFGTGISGSVEGLAADLIEFVNLKSAEDGFPVVAVDIPSGVDADTGKVATSAIHADLTVCLQCPKVGNVLYPGTSYAGEIFVAEIGVSTEISDLAENPRWLITEPFVKTILEDGYRLDPEVHKSKRGHVLVIGGSNGYYGAPQMSAEAALRAGAGMVTMLLPAEAADRLGPLLKELMYEALDDEETGSFTDNKEIDRIQELLKSKRAIVLGPGLGVNDGARKLVAEVLLQGEKCEIPMVLDADALNILASTAVLKEMLSPLTILTPHPGEMARLAGVTPGKVQDGRLEIAAEISARYGCWIVLKGARTVIAGPGGEILVNPAAIPVLATAGSGDVLAGIISALLANGIPPGEAAAAGVFLHGAAGEVLTVKNGGSIGVIASDITELVPKIINILVHSIPQSIEVTRKILPGSLHGRDVIRRIEESLLR